MSCCNPLEHEEFLIFLTLAADGFCSNLLPNEGNASLTHHLLNTVMASVWSNLIFPCCVRQCGLKECAEGRESQELTSSGSATDLLYGLGENR